MHFSMPEKEMSKRGLTMTMSAMINFLCSYDKYAGELVAAWREINDVVLEPAGQRKTKGASSILCRL
jgi:hypothetical protein